MLLLSFKTCLQIVSKFLVQVMWKDSYHFSPVQGSLSIQWADSGNFWGKKKTQKPRLSKGTGTICSDRGEHQGISAALLSIEVHSQLQTAHNLSRCSHGAVETNNKKMVVEWDSFSWAKAHCIGEEQVPAVAGEGLGPWLSPGWAALSPGACLHQACWNILA